MHPLSQGTAKVQLRLSIVQRRIPPFSPFQGGVRIRTCRLRFDTTAAPNLSSSVRDPCVHHVQVPDPNLPPVFFARSSAALWAEVSSSIMVVLTAGFCPGSGQWIVSALLQCACSIAATLPTGAPRVGYSKRSCDFEPSHAFGSLATTRCSLASRATAAGVSHESHITAPLGVVGSAPRMDLA